ncbi:hypothetical protein EQ845_07160 [Pseudomonas putida]|uniref:hypothetical protein n=1 Tax=Pseudomonas putida TaxID=303 RepID=UPI00117A9D8D|nr:hypothetical protein [Pseudomonas putida]TRO38240.1 hypothetical protein EQ845_07160 [Pseudomonas putida]
MRAKAVFVTDPEEEVVTLLGKVDPTFKSWPRVDTSETFYQVHTRRRVDRSYKNDITGVVLLATPQALLEFLGICDKDQGLMIVQVVLSTPPYANRSRRWRTEKLMELDACLDEYGVPNTIIYYTENDSYVEDRVYGKAGGKRMTLYKSR